MDFNESGQQYNPKMWLPAIQHGIEVITQKKGSRMTKRLTTQGGKFKYTRQETKFNRTYNAKLSKFICTNVKRCKCRASIFERINDGLYMYQNIEHKCADSSYLNEFYNKMGKKRIKRKKNDNDSPTSSSSTTSKSLLKKRPRSPLSNIELELNVGMTNTNINIINSNTNNHFDDLDHVLELSPIVLTPTDQFGENILNFPSLKPTFKYKNFVSGMTNELSYGQNEVITSKKREIKAYIYGSYLDNGDIAGGSLIYIYFDFLKRSKVLQELITPNEAQKYSAIDVNIASNIFSIGKKQYNAVFEKEECSRWKECQNASLEMIIRLKPNSKAEKVSIIFSKDRNVILGEKYNGFTYTDSQNISNNDDNDMKEVSIDFPDSNNDFQHYNNDGNDEGNDDYDMGLGENSLIDSFDDYLFGSSDMNNEKRSFIEVPESRFLRVVEKYKKVKDVFGFDLIMHAIARRREHLAVYLLHLYQYDNTSLYNNESINDGGGNVNKNLKGVRRVDRFGNTYLHWGYFYGCQNVIKYVLNVYTENNLKIEKNYYGLLPRQFSREKWRKNSAEVRERSMKFNDFTLFIKEKSKNFAQKLKNFNDFDVNSFHKHWCDELNDYITSPITYCCMTNQFEKAKLLLNDERFDPMLNDGELMKFCHVTNQKEIQGVLEGHKRLHDKSTDSGKNFERLKTLLKEVKVVRSNKNVYNEKRGMMDSVERKSKMKKDMKRKENFEFDVVNEMFKDDKSVQILAKGTPHTMEIVKEEKMMKKKKKMKKLSYDASWKSKVDTTKRKKLYKFGWFEGEDGKIRNVRERDVRRKGGERRYESEKERMKRKKRKEKMKKKRIEKELMYIRSIKGNSKSSIDSIDMKKRKNVDIDVKMRTNVGGRKYGKRKKKNSFSNFRDDYKSNRNEFPVIDISDDDDHGDDKDEFDIDECLSEEDVEKAEMNV